MLLIGEWFWTGRLLRCGKANEENKQMLTQSVVDINGVYLIFNEIQLSD